MAATRDYLSFSAICTYEVMPVEVSLQVHRWTAGRVSLLKPGVRDAIHRAIEHHFQQQMSGETAHCRRTDVAVSGRVARARR